MPIALAGRDQVSANLLPGRPLAHHALDDATEQAALFANLWRDGITLLHRHARLREAMAQGAVHIGDKEDRTRIPLMNGLTFCSVFRHLRASTSRIRRGPDFIPVRRVLKAA